MGWLRRLQEKPEEEECHCNHRDGDEGSFPGTEQQSASPSPAKEHVERNGKDGANQLQVKQRTDDQTDGGYQQDSPDFPDSSPGFPKDDAQHETDDKRYECHEQIIHEDV